MSPFESRFVEVHGRPVHYLEAGTGPELLLLHGGGPQTDAAGTWRTVIPALTPHFHVIAPDLAGFGQTPPTDDWSMLGRAAHAAAFVETLGLGDVALVGHSQGGFVAARMAITGGNRFRALVIVSSGTTAPGGVLGADGEYSPALRATLQWRRDPTFEGFCETNRMLAYHPERLGLAELRESYDRMLERGLLDLEAERARRNHTADPRAYARLHEDHVRPFAADLTLPTLLVWGRDDDFAPVGRALELAELLPGADLLVLGRCKHQVMRDRPEALVRAVTNFVSHTPAASAAGLAAPSQADISLDHRHPPLDDDHAD